MNYFLMSKLFKRKPEETSTRQVNLEKDPVKTSLSTIEKRETYAYRYWCFLCPSSKEQRIMKKGMKRIEKELDVENFLALQKMMRVTFNTIYTVTERHLLRNNQLFVLNSSSSHSEN